MAQELTIDVNISDDYKAIIVTDQTDWSSLGVTIDVLTEVILYFYTSNTTTADYTYEFTADNLVSYISNGNITLTFEDLFGREYALDNGYEVKMVANTEAYVSNFAFFGSDAYITNKVYENINNLRTPEVYRNGIEPLALQVMFLTSMRYLDRSTIIDRNIKWKRRLNALNKLNA
jgi:hypothetical protein